MNSPTLFPPAVRSDALISPCGLYRYWLSRTWDDALPTVCWIGLNPSTADASKDDPTIRRITGFTRAWGFGGFVAVNLFALRATDPRQILRAQHPVAEVGNSPVVMFANANDAWITFQTRPHRRVIAAWGAGGSLNGRDRQVMKLLKEDAPWNEAGGKHRVIECLGTTAAGHPRHPLYMPATATPVPFSMGGSHA